MDLERYLLPCTNKMIFGFDCPGCGLQRAVLLLLEGRFAEAFQMFPAVYSTVVLFTFIGLHFVDRHRSYHKKIIVMAIVNTVVLIAAYLFKIIFIFT